MTPRRRDLMATALAAGLAGSAGTAWSTEPRHPQRRWHLEALRMRVLAESWGDQPYGAVVVADDQVIGLGPSRVVKDGDPEAHAERVAIREALRSQGRGTLAGAVLYSTSRPCAACEAAAARSGIARMYHGDDLRDAGVPRGR